MCCWTEAKWFVNDWKNITVLLVIAWWQMISKWSANRLLVEWTYWVVGVSFVHMWFSKSLLYNQWWSFFLQQKMGILASKLFVQELGDFMANRKQATGGTVEGQKNQTLRHTRSKPHTPNFNVEKMLKKTLSGFPCVQGLILCPPNSSTRVKDNIEIWGCGGW